jgi:uncharacterized protein
MSATILTKKATRLLFLFATPGIYIASCLLVAASLAYPLHKLHLIPLDFHGLVGRGAYVLLILGIYPLGRLFAVDRTELGLNLPAAKALPYLGQGLILGILTLGAHTLLLVLLNVRHIDPERLGWATLLDASWKAALVGLILGFAEELLFRGFLLGALVKKAGWSLAMLTTAFYFSGLHFLSTDLRPGTEEAQWFTGFILLKSALEHLAATQLDSFLALFACGLFLAAMRNTQSDKGLAYCIGIHAGWIFVMKTVKSFTTLTVPSHFSGLVSGFDGIIGWLSTIWLGLLIAFLLIRKQRRVEKKALV